MEMNLNDACKEAFLIGNRINLDGCHYGPHKRTKRYYEVIPYYYMLAGLVRMFGFTSALEIGTHYGGSAMAMSRGMDGKGKIVTIDITKCNQEVLGQYPDIVRVKGDSIDMSTRDRVAEAIERVDLIYIDSFHTYDHVKANILLYDFLQPQFIVLDDIRINESMVQVWQELSDLYNTCDVTEICQRNCGFGVVRARK